MKTEGKKIIFIKMDRDTSPKELESIADLLSNMLNNNPELEEKYYFIVSMFDALTKEQLIEEIEKVK